MSAAIFLLALAAIGSVSGTGSGSQPAPGSPKACTLPELPKYYSTALQVNVETIERSTAADGGENARPLPTIGYSLSAAEFVDETMARAVLDIEYG